MLRLQRVLMANMGLDTLLAQPHTLLKLLGRDILLAHQDTCDLVLQTWKFLDWSIGSLPRASCKALALKGGLDFTEACLARYTENLSDKTGI